MEEQISNPEAIKYRQIAELLSEHIARLAKVSKDCETTEEILDITNTLLDLSNIYWTSKKKREDAHFRLI